MHGDITRVTFDPAKAYSSVRQQQGRVATDADWNEEREIALHDQRAARVDVLGRHGAPVGSAGMAVTVAGADLQVGAGRYYVDGIRVDNPAPITLPKPPEKGIHLVHLDVRERPVTAVEDPSIREVALGGPDTTTRTQVAFRAGLLPVAAVDAHCGSKLDEWSALAAPSTGTLEVTTGPTAANPSPCLVPEEAGFRGLDNRTYRVQIHGGTVDPLTGVPIPGAAPTFVWSRENASVVASWTAKPVDLTVEIERLGPGGAEGFARGALVELLTDKQERDRTPGILTTIEEVRGSTLVLTTFGTGSRAAAITALDTLYTSGTHPRVRRWEGSAATPLPTAPLELEDGLRVQFSAAGTFRSGDFWIVPARTAILPGTTDRQIEWVAGAHPPHGPVHHRVRLALATWDGTDWLEVTDCRELFAPLTDDLQFTARGGDGQEGGPDRWLPAPLIVGVSHGIHPAVGERVLFSVASGGGTLSAEEPDGQGLLPGIAAPEPVTVDDTGLARVWWRLGPAATPLVAPDAFDAAAAQVVVASLLGPGGAVEHLPLEFRATAVDPLVLVAAGGDGQLGVPGETLEIALRARVSAGGRPAPGQPVQFEIENTMLAGAALDEIRGGSLIPGPEATEPEPWAGGTRIRRVVVPTDEKGMAQLQWVLGTERGLPVQRVSATLRDATGTQTVLYSAHLAMASEVSWVPCDRLVKPAGENPTVQTALDLYCRSLAGLGGRGVAVLGGGARPILLAPDRTVPIGEWTGLLQIRLPFPLTDDPPGPALDAAVVVSAEIAVPEGRWAGARHTVQLPGKVGFSRTEEGVQVEWQASEPRLTGDDIAPGPVLLRVLVLPSLLGDGIEIMPWHAAVQVGS